MVEIKISNRKKPCLWWLNRSKVISEGQGHDVTFTHPKQILRAWEARIKGCFFWPQSVIPNHRNTHEIALRMAVVEKRDNQLHEKLMSTHRCNLSHSNWCVLAFWQRRISQQTARKKIPNFKDIRVWRVVIFWYTRFQRHGMLSQRGDYPSPRHLQVKTFENI
jgi:hypothetical protein